MNPHRISVKIPVAEGANVDLDAVIPVFHQWIRDDLTDTLLIDVADYKHVPDGPGVMLIGHEGDFALDIQDDQPGVMYTLKRGDDRPLEARLARAIELATWGADKLAGEASLSLSFDASRMTITFQDRLEAPNTAEAFEAGKAAVEQAVSAALGDVDPQLERASEDERRGLGYAVRLTAAAK